MTVRSFDRLRLTEMLRDNARMSAEQAEIGADAVAHASYPDLAAKAGIEELRREFEALRLAVRADIAEAKADIMRWAMIGAFTLQTIVVLGVIVAMSRSIH